MMQCIASWVMSHIILVLVSKIISDITDQKDAIFPLVYLQANFIFIFMCLSFSGNIASYWHFMPLMWHMWLRFFPIENRAVYPTSELTPHSLMMIQWLKEPRHRQPSYCLSYSGIFQTLHQIIKACQCGKQFHLFPHCLSSQGDHQK